MFEYTLVVPRGAVFHAVAWPLVDRNSEPVRDPTGMAVLCKARPWRTAEVAAILPTSVVLLVLPDRFGDEPVVAAQIDAMTPEQTAAFPLETGAWDILVDGERLGGGQLVADLVMSRP